MNHITARKTHLNQHKHTPITTRKRHNTSTKKIPEKKDPSVTPPKNQSVDVKNLETKDAANGATIQTAKVTPQSDF